MRKRTLIGLIAVLTLAVLAVVAIRQGWLTLNSKKQVAQVDTAGLIKPETSDTLSEQVREQIKAELDTLRAELAGEITLERLEELRAREINQLIARLREVPPTYRPAIAGDIVKLIASVDTLAVDIAARQEEEKKEGASEATKQQQPSRVVEEQTPTAAPIRQVSERNGHPDQFTTEVACLNALESGRFDYYDPTYFTPKPLSDGQYERALEADQCFEMYTVKGWAWVVQREGTVIVFNKNNKPVRRKDCGNAIRDYAELPPPDIAEDEPEPYEPEKPQQVLGRCPDEAVLSVSTNERWHWDEFPLREEGGNLYFRWVPELENYRPAPNWVQFVTMSRLSPDAVTGRIDLRKIGDQWLIPVNAGWGYIMTDQGPSMAFKANGGDGVELAHAMAKNGLGRYLYAYALTSSRKSVGSQTYLDDGHMMYAVKTGMGELYNIRAIGINRAGTSTVQSHLDDKLGVVCIDFSEKLWVSR